jgi:hypothetical protein
MGPDETLLWAVDDGTSCLMVVSCSGAELQLRRGGRVLLRERYPDKSTLYERARALQLTRQPPPPDAASSR